MPAARPPRRNIQLLVLVGLSFAAFGSALAGDFVSDDHQLIARGTLGVADALRARFWGFDEKLAGGLYTHAYRPVVQLAWALQKRAFGAEPLGFHLVGLGLHAVNTLLVWRWLSRRLSADGAAGRVATSHAEAWAALFGAALFAVHPAHAESVAWVSGATDLWMTCGWLVALELLPRQGLAALVAGASALALAVLAKEPAAVAPGLLLIDAWALPGFRGMAWRPVWLGSAAVLLAVGIVLAVGWGASGARADLDVSFVAALALTGEYARLALLPLGLTFQSQPYDVTATGLQLSTAAIATGGLIWSALLVLAGSSVRHPRFRPWLSDALWFLLPLLPILCTLQSLLSDRFLYAPLLGVVAISARGFARLLASAEKSVRFAVAAAATLTVGLSLPLAVRASQNFLGDESLWRSQVAARPEFPQASDALGEALTRLGRFDEASLYFGRGLQNALALGQRAVAQHFIAHLFAAPANGRQEWESAVMARVANRCQTLFDRREAVLDDVADGLKLALSAAEAKRLAENVPMVLVPCARALLATQDLAGAGATAERATRFEPRDPAAAELLARALARLQRFDDALLVLARLRTLAPQHDLGRLARAIESARDRAAQHPATDPRGESLFAAEQALSLGSPEAARRALQSALASAPTDHALVHALAQTYVAELRFAEAQAAIEHAAVLAPSDPHWDEALANLTVAQREFTSTTARGERP